MIDSLIAIDQERVTLVEERKSVLESKLSAWQTFNTKLLALKTAAEALNSTEDFLSFTSKLTSSNASVDASDLLSVSVSDEAVPGTYSITVLQTATAQKISSDSFSSPTEALGSSFAGDIVINGVTVAIDAGDSLNDLRDRINDAGAGVTATVVRYGTGDYRLSVASDDTGEAGISIANGGASDILNLLGFTDGTRTAQYHMAGGDKSSTFTSDDIAVGDLLELTSAEIGTIQINGTGVEIDLAGDSLATIAGKLTGAGISASVVNETNDGETVYRLFIEGGSNTYIDSANILETLGVIRGGFSDVMGVEGDVKNTSGAEAITADTLIKDLDGYSGYAAGDFIYMAGTDTSGGTVSLSPAESLVIDDDTTVGDLLAKIEAVYGDVTASITSDGKLKIVDNTTGESPLAVQLSVKNSDESADNTISFATGGDLGTAEVLRSREVVAGTDGIVEIDGATITSSSNSISDAIEGVTLDLLQADEETTITLSVTRDTSAILSKITAFVSSYNTVASYISEQQSYDEESETTGGVLFGDGTLSSVKTDLTSSLLQSVWGVDSDFSYLSFVGISIGDDGLLTTDMTALGDYLESNFSDIVSLFAVKGTADGADLEYVSSGEETQAGAYTVKIDQAATKGTAVGTTDLSGSLSGDVTLAVTVSGYSAGVELTAGMTLSEIVDAVNTEMDTAREEIQVGAVKLYEGGGSSTALTAETAWDQVYVGANSANLEDGDRISFSGTDHSGNAVSGVYEIDSVGSDTVQGLLTAIESAYDGTVTASIDGEGRIVITDETTGASRLGISFDMEEAHQLTFGTVDVSEDGSDGSRQGRYALAVTASDDGAGHLTLTHDSYGSSAGFTVSQTGGDIQEIRMSDTALTTADSSGEILADETTTWNELYGTTVGEGDTLTISGVTLGGADVGPVTYNLYEAGAFRDIGSLLDEIETAFGGSGVVDARIEDGKIVLESLVSGEGSLSLTLTANNEGEGSDLDLGTFSLTERNLSLGLVNGTTQGLDVVGSINGEAASGSGQVLTGTSTSGKTAGLVVKYTGSTTTNNAGTVTVTVGIGELFSRTLDAITSGDDGYVTFKKESLQNSIDELDTKIDEMNDYLTRKKEVMTARYVSMELLLSKLQNTSTWLTTQLTALFQ
jgi:flagellar hook-associated protein 2